MKNFMDEFLRLKLGFLRRMRFLLLLDIFLIFSIVYAIFIILNIEYFLEKLFKFNYESIVLAFIISIAFAFLLHRKDKHINLIIIIENKYTNLKEKLRTAYDNKDKSNIIVDSLKNQVSDDLTKISPSSLIPTKKVLLRVIITTIFILGAMMISLNPENYTIPPETLNNITHNIIEKTNITNSITGHPEIDENTGFRGKGDILGKPKIASIQGKNIDLTLYSGIGEGFIIKEVSETQNSFIPSKEFPVNIVGSNISDTEYLNLMKKTQVEKELINKYAIERSKI